MKSSKSRNIDISRITSTANTYNKDYSTIMKNNLTSRTDSLNQNSTITSIKIDYQNHLNNPQKKNEKSIINSKIHIKQNFNQYNTTQPLYEKTSCSNNQTISLNQSRNFKKSFRETTLKAKTTLFDTNPPRRLFIKIDKTYGKPSNQLLKINERVLTTSRSHSKKTFDTKSRIFNSEINTSCEIKNYRSFKYPQGQAKIGDLLTYKNGPNFKPDQLAKSINKNEFNILKEVKKYSWEK